MTILQFKYRPRLKMFGFPNSKRFVGKCPNHKSKKDNFLVDYHSNEYRCFECEESGVIKNLEKKYKIVTEIREDRATLFMLLDIRDMLDNEDDDGGDNYWC